MEKGIYTMSGNTFLLWCLYLRQPDADFTVHYAENTQSHWLVFICYRYIFFISFSFIYFMYSYDLDKCIFFFFSAFSLLPFFCCSCILIFYLWPFSIIIIFPNFVCQSLQSLLLKSQPVVEIILQSLLSHMVVLDQVLSPGGWGFCLMRVPIIDLKVFHCGMFTMSMCASSNAVRSRSKFWTLITSPPFFAASIIANIFTATLIQ